ncbi:MAG: hypothetical protein DMENIID0003_04020 [Wolbachia endosymbiont of Sergentomyia squamirostris]|uniref:Uncharacterized protein n=3 Tax=unclassified Wolbachia TaxID=2640676 RepID=A0AAT9GBU1_9RICK
MSNINRIIREVIKEFRSKLPDKEIEEYSGKLNKLHIYQCNKHIIENKKLYHYTINGKTHAMGQHGHNFVKSLEVILRNKPQISLEEVIDFMEKIINFGIDSCYGAFEMIFESRSGVTIDDAVNFVKDSLSSKFYRFHGSGIFKVILELNPESSLEEIEKQFSKVVDPYFLNAWSRESERAFAKICRLCREGHVENMQKFDFSNFNLDQDSAGALRALLQYCVDVSNQKALGDSHELHREEMERIYKFDDNYDLNLDSDHNDSIWH